MKLTDSSSVFDKHLREGQQEEDYVINWLDGIGAPIMRRSNDKCPDIELLECHIEVKRKEDMQLCHSGRVLDIKNGKEDATGYQMDEYNVHCEMDKKKPVFVWFYDPTTGLRSGNWLKNLHKYRIQGEYMNIGKNIVLFDVAGLWALDEDSQRRWALAGALDRHPRTSAFYFGELRS